MTQKTEQIGVRVTPAELLSLQLIGTNEQLFGLSEVIRYLIRQEAKRREIWEEVVAEASKKSN